MKKYLATLCTFMLFVMIFVSIPIVLAAVDSPTTLTISRVDVYRDCIEEGDQLYLVIHEILYSGTPPTEGTAEDLFLFRLNDGVTTLGSTTVYPYYNYGFDYGIVGIYFSASEIATLGMGWGAGQGYSMTLSGNPLYTWTSGTPPTTTLASFDLWYDDGDTPNYLTTRMRVIAQQIEREWGIDLVSGPAGYRSLTSYGEDYFTNSIPNLRLITPELFGAVLLTPTFDHQGYINIYYTADDNTSMILGNTATYYQTFSVPETFVMDQVELYLTTNGTPTVNAIVGIYNVGAGGTPTGSAVTSGTISANNVLTQRVEDAGEANDWLVSQDSTYEDLLYPTWFDVPLGDGATLSRGSTYALGITSTNTSSANSLAWAYDSDGGFSDGQAMWYASGSWNATTCEGDYLFINKSTDAHSASQARILDERLVGGPFDLSGLGEILGVSRLWASTLVWWILTMAFVICACAKAQTYKPALIIVTIMLPVGAFAGFIHMYFAIVVAFACGIGVVYTIAWRQT